MPISQTSLLVLGELMLPQEKGRSGSQPKAFRAAPGEPLCARLHTGRSASKMRTPERCPQRVPDR